MIKARAAIKTGRTIKAEVTTGIEEMKMAA
jgi:hypothetical protein